MPEGYIPPNITPKCSWNLDKDVSESPHHHVDKKYELDSLTVCGLSIFLAFPH